MSPMISSILSAILHLPRISRSKWLWRIDSNLSNTMDRWIISSLILRGLWRCRSIVVNTTKRSPPSGSHTWWTMFLWVRPCWHTSPLPKSPIRARSLFSKVSSCLMSQLQFDLSCSCIPIRKRNILSLQSAIFNITLQLIDCPWKWQKRPRWKFRR